MYKSTTGNTGTTEKTTGTTSNTSNPEKTTDNTVTNKKETETMTGEPKKTDMEAIKKVRAEKAKANKARKKAQALRNKQDILSLSAFAKLVNVSGDKRHPVYKEFDPTKEKSANMICKKATALFLPDGENTGLLLDFRNWHDVRIIHAYLENNQYHFDGGLCYEAKRGYICYNKFLVPASNDIPVKKKLLITTSEVMFIGAIIHSQLLVDTLYYFDPSFDIDTYDLEIIWGYLTANWAAPDDFPLRCVINSDTSKFTSDMSYITMESIDDSDYYKSVDTRLTEGPGLLRGTTLADFTGKHYYFSMRP